MLSVLVACSLSRMSRACTSMVTSETSLLRSCREIFPRIISVYLMITTFHFLYRLFIGFFFAGRLPLPSSVSTRSTSNVQLICAAVICICPLQSRIQRSSPSFLVLFSELYVAKRARQRVSFIIPSTRSSHSSTATPSTRTAWLNVTSSFSGLIIFVAYMPPFLFSASSSRLMASKHFFRCGCTFVGSRACPRISSRSSFDRK
mmetsp:Transcript_69157/g.115371  ORF Transcript_69157/g.115371 Transcript_69157/m.115371 type:complete len:203 (-) Transcript_69157:1254-1862(-)